MVCSKCGKTTKEGKYCTFCGALLHKKDLNFDNTNTLMRFNIKPSEVPEKSELTEQSGLPQTPQIEKAADNYMQKSLVYIPSDDFTADIPEAANSELDYSEKSTVPESSAEIVDIDDFEDDANDADQLTEQHDRYDEPNTDESVDEPFAYDAFTDALDENDKTNDLISGNDLQVVEEDAECSADTEDALFDIQQDEPDLQEEEPLFTSFSEHEMSSDYGEDIPEPEQRDDMGKSAEHDYGTDFQRQEDESVDINNEETRQAEQQDEELEEQVDDVQSEDECAEDETDNMTDTAEPDIRSDDSNETVDLISEILTEEDTAENAGAAETEESDVFIDVTEPITPDPNADMSVPEETYSAEFEEETYAPEPDACEDSSEPVFEEAKDDAFMEASTDDAEDMHTVVELQEQNAEEAYLNPITSEDVPKEADLAETKEPQVNNDCANDTEVLPHEPQIDDDVFAENDLVGTDVQNEEPQSVVDDAPNEAEESLSYPESYEDETDEPVSDDDKLIDEARDEISSEKTEDEISERTDNALINESVKAQNIDYHDIDPMFGPPPTVNFTASVPTKNSDKKNKTGLFKKKRR